MNSDIPNITCWYCGAIHGANCYCNCFMGQSISLLNDMTIGGKRHEQTRAIAKMKRERLNGSTIR